VGEFQVGQGDISPSAVRAENDSVVVVAPFAPGLKQLSYAYRLPPASFPLAIPLLHDVMVLEVLLEEPTATVQGAKLKPEQAVSVQGRTFARWLAHDVPANAVLRITVAAAARRGLGKRWLAALAMAIALAMLLALALALRRRRVSVAPAPTTAPAPSADFAPSPDGAEALARAIAQLDTDFEQAGTPSATARAAYESRRGELKARLAAALDARRRGA
jgi:hypothetical protein